MQENNQNNNQQVVLKPVTVDGMLTIANEETGLIRLDFDTWDEFDARMIKGKFFLRGYHDGKIYMIEIPKRERNTPIFRDDNCSFSLGKDGKYYFYFTMKQEDIKKLPAKLVKQASAIAQKIIKGILNNNMEG